MKKIIKILLIVFVCYQLCFKVILNIKLFENNEEFIKVLLGDNSKEKYLDSSTLLENYYHFKTDTVYNMKFIQNKIEKKEEVLIYNTHQKESYQGETLKEYNISPGVLMASYLLKTKLEENKIKSLVIEDNITEYMNLNNIKYSDSYKASRYFVESALKNNNFKLIIDLHRDSISYDKATVLINEKKYAKIIFVVGLEHPHASYNLENAKKLNNLIKKKYPTLTRGVLEKKGKNVNGIYNQDLSENVFLLEIGTDTSNIEEVFNTIELIAPIIAEYINE